MQRSIANAPSLCRCFYGTVICAFGLVGFSNATAGEATPRFAPTASGYFLSAPAAAQHGNSRTLPTLGASYQAAPARLADANVCRRNSARNPLCQLRWTTGRTRGSDVRARYDAMTEGVKTRIVGNSRSEYFDLELDTSPEFRFKLDF